MCLLSNLNLGIYAALSPPPWPTVPSKGYNVCDTMLSKICY